MSFDKAKAITTSLLFLTDQLKAPKKGKLSADGLANIINDNWPANAKRFRFDGNKISAILRGWHLRPDEQDSLLEALRSTVAANNLDFDVLDVPHSVESKYRLPDIFERHSSAPLQGGKLGDLATELSGTWTFFYVSPIDRNGEFNTEIRKTVSFILEADAADTSVTARMISTRGAWKGQLFVNGTHLYVILSDVDRTETAFFVTNRPFPKRPFLAGVGTALTRFDGQAMPPVFGFLFFAEKWTVGKADFDPQTMVAIQKLRQGSMIAEDDIARVREAFCKSYTPDEFEREYPALTKYVKTLRINGISGFSSLPSLHIAWP